MRNKLLAAMLSLSVLSATAFAAEAPVYHVVKLVSFGCKFSQESKAIDELIKAKVTAQGGKFVFSPISADGKNFSAPLMYYAFRPFAGDKEGQFIDSLYKGAIELGLPYEDPNQIAVYLSDQSDLAGVNWGLVAAHANDEPNRASARKAVNLVLKAGITQLPAYVVVANGEVVAAFERTSTDAGWLNTLRNQVVGFFAGPTNAGGVQK